MSQLAVNYLVTVGVRNRNPSKVMPSVFTCDDAFNKLKIKMFVFLAVLNIKLRVIVPLKKEEELNQKTHIPLEGSR